MPGTLRSSWLAFLVPAIIVLTLQAIGAPCLEIHGIRPDFLLVVVVFLSLYAQETDAVIAAWSLGFCADLMTIERLGLISLSYGLTAALVASKRDYLFRHHWITQFAVTAAAALFIQTAWMSYRWLLYRPFDCYAGYLSVLESWTTGCLLASIYTAAWAPLVHAGLLRTSRWLGITHPRYTHAGSRQRGDLHV